MQKIMNKVATVFVAGLISWVLPHLTKLTKSRIEENNNDSKYESQKKLAMSPVDKQLGWRPTESSIPLG